MGKQLVTFSLDTDRDRDLARWLASLPKGGRSAAIREALRAGLGRGGVTLGDVHQAVRDLERKLQAGAFVAPRPVEEPDEPADVAQALDSLGL